MSKIRARVGELERTSGVGSDSITATIRETFEPGPNGSQSFGIYHINVFGSDQHFSRDDYQTEADLIAAANAEHFRVHGKPLEHAEGSAA